MSPKSPKPHPKRSNVSGATKVVENPPPVFEPTEVRENPPPAPPFSKEGSQEAGGTRAAEVVVEEDLEQAILGVAEEIGQPAPSSPALETVAAEMAPPPKEGRLDRFGRSQEAAKGAEGILSFLYRHYFRVQIEGLEHIPAKGRVILVANHAGIVPYDALMMMHALRAEIPTPRTLRPLVEDLFAYAPFLGEWMLRIGCVRACQENAQALLEKEEAILVFPEGYKGLIKPFPKRYELERFGRGGFIKLALRTQASILPVAIVGSQEIHPVLSQISPLARALKLPYFPITPTWPLLGPLGLLPLPVRWKIKISRPLPLPEAAEASENPLFVSQFSDALRDQLQGMVDALRKKRRSWFF